MTKKAGIFVLCWLWVMSVLYCTETIINPALPMKKGDENQKVLVLKEVLRIRDTAGEFYFKEPKNLKISTTGDIFLLDKRQLLKFDPTGKFCGNFFQFGQGPKEVINITNYLLLGNELIIHSSGLSKVIIFNHQTTELIKEFKVPFYSYSHLFYLYGDKLIFNKSEHVDTGGKLRMLDVAMSLISISMENGQAEEMIGFPVKYLVIKAGDHSFISQRAKFLSCPITDDLMIISHTSEYNLLLYSFKTNAVIKRFKREYKRVKVDEVTEKYAPGGNLGKIGLGNGEWFDSPVDEYHRDVQELLKYKDKLWVVTSTSTVDNKVLVDVYDLNGKVVDFFYVKLPSYIVPYQAFTWLECIDGDFLYAAEEDENGQKYITKYKIEKWN